VTEAGQNKSKANQGSPYQRELSRVFDSSHERVDKNASAPGQSCSESPHKRDDGFAIELLWRKKSVVLVAGWIEIGGEEHTIRLIHTAGNEDSEEATY
jgi:hypothetical protein